MKRIAPGVYFDGVRKLARFEVTLPGTDGRTRRRVTVPAKDGVEAVAKLSLIHI